MLVFLSGVKEVLATPPDGAEFNRRATATAQILAGITPNPPEPALKRFIDTDTFKEHQQWMTSSWSQGGTSGGCSGLLISLFGDASKPWKLGAAKRLR